MSRILWALCLLFCTSAFAQETLVTVSGSVKDVSLKQPLSFVNIVVTSAKDSSFVTGTVTNEDGRFSLKGIKPGNYVLGISFIGYTSVQKLLFVGSLTPFLDFPPIELSPDTHVLQEITVAGQQDAVDTKLDKKTYSVAENISQSGGSVLQVMQNLPGITVSDGKIQLRGSDKIAVLVDGKQTALTGFGSQTGLDNIPASAIERIEIINNPSARYDANGNAGIINIIYKKNIQEGWNGKAGLAAGLGALWERKENLPTIRPQYRLTPKINPSLSLNYRKKNINVFLQGDYLYTQTLNKNEFVTRVYDDGTSVEQQTKRNRNTGFTTTKAGVDWTIRPTDLLTVSALLGTEKIIDRGDEPFFNADLSERRRLWQFLEDELKTTVMATSTYQHKFTAPGHTLNAGFIYTFHRENEKYFFDNILPTYMGKDAFKLISDEQVADLTIDYVRPLTYGRLEAGLKMRRRSIPTDMLFIPGLNSPLDTTAGGKATYRETIPAVYGTYIFENQHWEAEAGLRVEYVLVGYEVNPSHPTYKSDGYQYTQPFPTLRAAYKLSDRSKVSLFYNRRVDRPNEVDIRIFPKYDDAEIIKVGNPTLRPQFTNSLELGYKTSWASGYWYGAAYHRWANGTITRIASTVPGSTLIYAIFQNAGRSYNTGVEVIVSQAISPRVSLTLNAILYQNQIDAFTVENKYPKANTFTTEKEQLMSGNVKINGLFKLPRQLTLQVSSVYLAPDIIPQGRIDARFSVDAGLKKSFHKDREEIFLNATDLLNTLIIRRTIQGAGFQYTSTDYYETQVVRAGYTYKF
jgi:outer membrane receptor protein involved in Fe transport